MIVVCGGLLGLGLLLIASPWLWPARTGSETVDTGLWRASLDAAGLAHVRTRTVPSVMAATGAVVGAAAWLATGLPAVTVLAVVAGAATPVIWLRARAARLLRLRRAMWPDLCDLMIASVRAGMSLPDAVGSLQVSAPPPLRPAFARFARDVVASGSFDAAAQRLKTVLADPVADRIVETLRMARQVGGTQLVPVLRALGSSVRADTAVRAEIEARQSWIRGTAVLGVVAPWVVLVLLAMRPEAARAYATPAGVLLVSAGAVVCAVAYWLMVRLGRLPAQRRWFS